jgi:uncharacterized secreted protein with C-terminal beta-propeller domain
VVIIASCAASAGPLTRPTPATAPDGSVRLVSSDSCDSALSALRRAALPHVGPSGFASGSTTDKADVAVGRAESSAKAVPELPAAPDHTATNIHEAGVDEPDVVKTDGRRVVTVSGGRLRVVDAASHTITGTVDLPTGSAAELVMHGDRALVILPAPGPLLERQSPPAEITDQGETRLVLVDLAGTPRVTGTLVVSGQYVDTRQVGGVARVVIRSGPRIAFVHPDGTRSGARSLQENRAALEDARIDDWLPRYRLEAANTRREGRLVDCARISHAAVHSATSMLTVLTFDLPRELGTGDAVSIVADGDTVYGTGTSLYVADDHHHPALPRTRAVSVPSTVIHQFDLSQAGPPRYAASGEVGGLLLNQYALSEYAGHLRVATTTTVTAVPCCARRPPDSHSTVTVLQRQGNTLVEKGRLDGLGAGERIQAVRFAGSVGYVVTFRQTDPLHTLDLSDPSRPRAVGELKITGYSAYLHPAGGTHLIGVGQEATEGGRRLGTQVSLFDIGDPAAPRRIAAHHLPESGSEVEFDPHAFLYRPDVGLIVVPVSRTVQVVERPQDEPVSGALVLRLRDGAFTELGMLRHPAAAPYGYTGIRRALVIGDELWTVSSAGILVSSADQLVQRTWLRFT